MSRSLSPILTTHRRLIVSLTAVLAWFGLWTTLSAYSSGHSGVPIAVASLLSYNVSVNVAPQSQTSTLSALADARVKDSSPSSNYGTDTELRARSSTSSSNYESYLKFDLSTVPTGAISSAKLRLVGALQDTSSLNVQQAVFAVSNTSWTETGITWGNKPVAANPALAAVPVLDNVVRPYEWDITPYIQKEQGLGHN
ncbi:MAG TPA: DNRLRE domain-containing protein, partial [Pyrinomonadaceae bacterium]|nr:DNRLRE domain-containing protein [Pyrinomonadaceae bacterium]